jgi:hypothetical protein
MHMMDEFYSGRLPSTDDPARTFVSAAFDWDEAGVVGKAVEL